MTRRTTSRAPGMFPGRQPSSHPNPCLGGCVPATPGANARLGGHGQYKTTAAKQAAAMGVEPWEGRSRRHHDGLETRQSEARRERGGPGTQTRRRARVTTTRYGYAPQTPRGMDRTTRTRHVQTSPGAGLTTRGHAPQPPLTVGLTACRWRTPQARREPRPQDTAPGLYHKRSGACDAAKHRTAVLNAAGHWPLA